MAPSRPHGTITLLFTDIEGSTSLLRQLGDEYASVLADQREILRAVFAKWNGHEADTQGDSFFVAFATAGDAVAAAAEAQQGLAAHHWPAGSTVRVRMGLHTGEPRVRSTGYVGMDVHRAARIAAAAHGGQVLLSQTTRDLVGENLPAGYGVLDLGDHCFKDFQSPQHIFQLIGPGLHATCPPLLSLATPPHNLPAQPTTFLGRDDLLAAAHELLVQTDVRLFTFVGWGASEGHESASSSRPPRRTSSQTASMSSRWRRFGIPSS
jgi:class 3 adenylate cyclase